jgi:hypothetical protein
MLIMGIKRRNVGWLTRESGYESHTYKFSPVPDSESAAWVIEENFPFGLSVGGAGGVVSRERVLVRLDCGLRDALTPFLASIINGF